MRTVIYLLVVVMLFACEPDGVSYIERDNPYPFLLRAEIEDGNKRFLLDVRDGRMYCDRLPLYNECVPCEEEYDYWDWNKECVYNEIDGRYYTADSCMCKGNYHIVSSYGLEIILKDPKKARYPSTFFTQVDGEIRYMNRSLQGKIMLTKSEIHTIFRQSDSSSVILVNSYFLDVAGGFEGSDGVVTISGGIFYSIKP